MASENAKAVAQEVLETIGKGQKVSLRKIIKEKGYAQNTADNPKLVTNTQSYQEEIKPLLDRMIEERDRAIGMLAKTINKAKYRDLTDGIDKLTKNIQLLNGGKTSNEALVIKWEK